ncbi:hypothetical protein Tco_1568382 [Tanacetum coccineum]
MKLSPSPQIRQPPPATVTAAVPPPENFFGEFFRHHNTTVTPPSLPSSSSSSCRHRHPHHHLVTTLSTSSPRPTPPSQPQATHHRDHHQDCVGVRVLHRQEAEEEAKAEAAKQEGKVRKAELIDLLGPRGGAQVNKVQVMDALDSQSAVPRTPQPGIWCFLSQDVVSLALAVSSVRDEMCVGKGERSLRNRVQVTLRDAVVREDDIVGRRYGMEKDISIVGQTLLQAVCYCARYQADRPDIKHLKRFFLDVNHAGCIDTRKSTSGGIQFLGYKLVSWMSKKQDCTTMSSAEAEYVVLSCKFVSFKSIWMEDNLRIMTSTTTKYRSGYALLKPLPEDRFYYLARRIGMRCLTPAELEVLANKSA